MSGLWYCVDVFSFQGFVSGITGIVTKPIKGINQTLGLLRSCSPDFSEHYHWFAGAQKEGAAGFFKGFGKGLVGAVARPTGGIIDMASSTFQGIKRYVDLVCASGELLMHHLSRTHGSGVSNELCLVSIVGQLRHHKILSPCAHHASSTTTESYGHIRRGRGSVVRCSRWENRVQV